jgi:hypothetical protein
MKVETNIPFVSSPRIFYGSMECGIKVDDNIGEFCGIYFNFSGTRNSKDISLDNFRIKSPKATLHFMQYFLQSFFGKVVK